MQRGEREGEVKEGSDRENCAPTKVFKIWHRWLKKRTVRYKVRIHVWTINRQQNKGPFAEVKEAQESSGYEEVLLFWACCEPLEWSGRRHCFSYNDQHVQEQTATPSSAQDKLLHGHLSVHQASRPHLEEVNLILPGAAAPGNSPSNKSITNKINCTNVQPNSSFCKGASGVLHTTGSNTVIFAVSKAWRMSPLHCVLNW